MTNSRDSWNEDKTADLELYKKNLHKALKNQAALSKQVTQLNKEKNVVSQQTNQLIREKNNLLQHIKQLNVHNETISVHAEQLELDLIDAKKKINELTATLEKLNEQLAAKENKTETPPASEIKEKIEKPEVCTPPVESTYSLFNPLRILGYKNQEKPQPIQTPLSDLTNANVQLAIAQSRLGKK